MMTAQQVCDVIAAGTQPGMTPNDMADFIQGRFANVDADIVEAGVRLASIEFRRQAERQLAEADELARFKRNRRLRVV
jgi:hypothetical protein